MILKSFIRQSFMVTRVFRFEFWTQIASFYIYMYSMYWIWHTLYRQNPAMLGADLNQIVTYSILGASLLTILAPVQGVHFYISNQIRTGLIDVDLFKPLDFLWHMFCRNTGEIVVRFSILFLPCITLAWLFLGFRPPADPFSLVMFIPSLLFAYLIHFCLSFLLGMLSVVTMDIRSISWTYYAILMFLSGPAIPLWLFPKSIAAVNQWLPFRCIFYVPMSIYVGKESNLTSLTLMAQQIIWAGILILICRLAWNRVNKRLVVQGG